MNVAYKSNNKRPGWCCQPFPVSWYKINCKLQRAGTLGQILYFLLLFILQKVLDSSLTDQSTLQTHNNQWPQCWRLHNLSVRQDKCIQKKDKESTRQQRDGYVWHGKQGSLQTSCLLPGFSQSSQQRKFLRKDVKKGNHKHEGLKESLRDLLTSPPAVRQDQVYWGGQPVTCVPNMVQTACVCVVCGRSWKRWAAQQHIRQGTEQEIRQGA